MSANTLVQHSVVTTIINGQARLSSLSSHPDEPTATTSGLYTHAGLLTFGLQAPLFLKSVSPVGEGVHSSNERMLFNEILVQQSTVG